MANEVNDSVAKDLSRLRLNEARNGGSDHDLRLRETVRKHHFERDITESYTALCRELNTDELVKHESFALFEAVSALEIMDHKVDVGVCSKGESYFDELDITKPLSPEEVLGIMDEIICLEVLWHDGLPLSQSIFTSLHVDLLFSDDRPPKELPTFASLLSSRKAEFESVPDLTEIVLRPYCLAAIKGCDMIVELVISREYQEEEDLCTNTYGRDLYTDIDDDAVVKELDAALHWVETNNEINDDIKAALILRLQSRRDFLTAFLVQQGQNHFERWQRMEEQYKLIQNSHPHAGPVAHAFSTKVLRKLPGNVPPRKPRQITFDHACASQVSLCNDTQEALRILEFDSTVSLDPLFDFLWPFTGRSHLPSAFARAVLQAHFVAPNHLAGPNEINQLLFNELNRFLCVEDEVRSEFWDVEVPDHPNHRAARLVDKFFSAVGLIHEKALRAMCQNRSRVRRGLTNTLEEMSSLSEEVIPSVISPPQEQNVKNNDQILTTQIIRHFSAVTAIACSRLATWVTQLGIEQNLYEGFELADMYCWITLNTRAICYRHAELEAVIRYKTRRTYSIISEEETYVNLAKADTLAATRMRWEGVSHLAEGAWLIYTLLYQTGHLTPPSSQYTTPALQHELRFRPYMNLGKYLPVPASYTVWSQRVSHILENSTSPADFFNTHPSPNHNPQSKDKELQPDPPLKLLKKADAVLSLARESLTQALKSLKVNTNGVAEQPHELATVYDVGHSRSAMRDEITKMLRVAVTARLHVGSLLNKMPAVKIGKQDQGASEAEVQVRHLREIIKSVEVRSEDAVGSWLLPKITT